MTRPGPGEAALRALASIASATVDGAGTASRREEAALERGRDWCWRAAAVVARGGRVLVLSEAECRLLDLGLGNSLGDPDFLEAYLSNPRQRAYALGAWGKLRRSP